MPDEGLFGRLKAGERRVEGKSKLRPEIRNGILAAQLEELRICQLFRARWDHFALKCIAVDRVDDLSDQRTRYPVI